MSGDSAGGYYSDLGVSPSATTDEIKAIYRALAKIYHPDVNGERAASATFRRITAAYEVLSDPERRRAYDAELSRGRGTAQGASPPGPQEEPLQPIQCSVCKRTTAQPRFLVFRYVRSFYLFTVRKPKAGIYCSRCAAK